MLDIDVNAELRATFPEMYNLPKVIVEIDEITGLAIVEKETILSKYGIRTYADNYFHVSVTKFFNKAGYLTTKQLEALRKH